mmetsp:Transcript_21935/g.71569  ORF Transcript_21935/g.71569 Transcript_21935/m.71569 type:complete len:225 (+) Transcript_21935:2-676(+)
MSPGRRTGRRAALAWQMSKSKFNTMDKRPTGLVLSKEGESRASHMAGTLDAEWAGHAKNIQNLGAKEIVAGKTTKTVRTMMIEGKRLLAGQLAIDDAFAAHGRYKVMGGGMYPFSAEGPHERDIQFTIVSEAFDTDWECQINSAYKLVGYRNCPADAKPLIKAALRELSEAKPCECSKCLKPCKKRHCARCKQVVYCSGVCQKSDWKAHKPFCVAAAAEKSSDK